MSGSCISCGCTDEAPCVDGSGGRCSWVDRDDGLGGVDLCSACVDPPSERGADGFAFDPETGLWLP